MAWYDPRTWFHRDDDDGERDYEGGCVFCGSDPSHTWQDGSPVCDDCQNDVEDEQWEAHLNGR